MKRRRIDCFTCAIAIIAIVTFLPASAYADRVVVFGATGNIGKVIVREALDRGHDVIGVSRDPAKFDYREENFTGMAGNPTNRESVIDVTTGADSIINAVGGREAKTPQETAMNQSAIAFSQAFAGLGEDGPRIVVVGGGLTSHGSREKIIENMPPNATEGSPFRALFLGHWVAYETYLASDINWTFVAPPSNIIGWRPGTGEDARTGNYRTSTEGFVIDAAGNSSLTVSDLAVAIVDFAETGEFNRQKVAVGN